jgi:transcriptional regulator with XRE-family HTH domain
MALLRTLKHRVRWARKTAGVGQTELSELAGLTRTHIGTFESDRTRGSLDGTTILALADVLGVSMEWLVAGRGETPSAEHLIASVLRAREARDARAAARRRRAGRGRVPSVHPSS